MATSTVFEEKETCTLIEENFDESINKCTQCIKSCSLSDESSSVDSLCEENSLSLSSDDDYINLGENVIAVKSENVCFVDKIVASDNQDTVAIESILGKEPNQYNNIEIYNSKNVHIGDITHINGPIYINHLTPTINQNIIINNTNKNKQTFPIVPRRTWLAQPPSSPNDVTSLIRPVQFVIICHSATEEAYTQTDNNLMVRLIQQFHIESRKWNDIAYNFLIGAEGSVYEGRGWNIVGAHTLGYNLISIGICFIGCYIQKLPPPIALRKAKELIKCGVEMGVIAENYSLIGHCQARSSESPGRGLYEELKTWDRWDGSVTLESPSPLSTF